MKLYIANQTSSQAAQIVANELGLTPELIHYNVFDKTTSNGDDFTKINALGYVPILVIDNQPRDHLSEVTVITSYLADQHPEAGLIPASGTWARVKFDQLMSFIATELAQKHIPLMRKLMTDEGQVWARAKLVKAYKVLDDRLADGRAYLAGDRFTVADAYAWATMWDKRSGTDIGHLEYVMAWKVRMDSRPSVRKTLKDEANIVAIHAARKAA